DYKVTGVQTCALPIYSLQNDPIPPNKDVVDWLLETHRGYCTYYASTMAIMGRLLGIPTRVVSGFSQGHFDQQRNIWAVDGSDARSEERRVGKEGGARW